MTQRGCVLLLVVAGACGGNEVRDGNDSLGIARFAIEDSAAKTSVIGFDGGNHEVGRLDLVHGRFQPTGSFKEDYPDAPFVDGRSLEVTLLGRRELTFQTAGYDPLLHLPAHPPSAQLLIGFLADPHVKVVLDRWQLAFESPERPYTYGQDVGDFEACESLDPYTLSKCGDARGYQINTCGNQGVEATDAARVTRDVTLWTGGQAVSERITAQCCPPTTAGTNLPTDSEWFGRKACRVDEQINGEPSCQGATGSSGILTSCGCGSLTAACKGCPEYPRSGDFLCNIVEGENGGMQFCYNDGPGPRFGMAFSFPGNAGVNLPGGISIPPSAATSGGVFAGGGQPQWIAACQGAPLRAMGVSGVFTFSYWDGACKGPGVCDLWLKDPIEYEVKAVFEGLASDYQIECIPELGCDPKALSDEDLLGSFAPGDLTVIGNEHIAPYFPAGYPVILTLPAKVDEYRFEGVDVRILDEHRVSFTLERGRDMSVTFRDWLPHKVHGGP